MSRPASAHPSPAAAGRVGQAAGPWVYTRIIRLYKALASRYVSNEDCGGIVTTETAIGNFDDSYTLAKYCAGRTGSSPAPRRPRRAQALLFYLNFLKGGDSSDMNKGARVSLLRALPYERLVIGRRTCARERQCVQRGARPCSNSTICAI